MRFVDTRVSYRQTVILYMYVCEQRTLLAALVSRLDGRRAVRVMLLPTYQTSRVSPKIQPCIKMRFVDTRLFSHIDRMMLYYDLS
jgi:hypothetical protein